MKNELKSFKPEASVPEHGIALMFDLAGFSKFFAQPDVHHYVPKYLNHVIEAITAILAGTTKYWVNSSEDKSKIGPLPKPIHWKFLGDGVLIIWKYNDFTSGDIRALMNRCWNLKAHFYEVNKHATKDIPVMDIPQKIRFGISAGTIYKLTYKGSTHEEYIGYCINLASRLQSYCRELGFIVSARLNPDFKDLDENDYLRVIAKNIKGFPNEIVIVDKNEYAKLDDVIKESLFDDLD